MRSRLLLVGGPSAVCPTTPPAWVLTTARRRAIDRIRTGAAEDRRLPLLIVDGRRAADTIDPADRAHTEGPLADERLRMLFACAHPALAPHAQVAMILRFVNGLTVSRIASLLLVPDSTVAARITRAKHRIAASGIPVVRPSRRTVDDRLDSVLTALYLTFTEGYARSGGDSQYRWGLADEAIRCTELVHDLLHGHPRSQRCWRSSCFTMPAGMRGSASLAGRSPSIARSATCGIGRKSSGHSR